MTSTTRRAQPRATITGATLAFMALLAACENTPDTAVASGAAGRTGSTSAASAVAAPRLAPMPMSAAIAADRETYQAIEANPVRLAAEHPVSTFSVDVDTGSYSNVRRLLGQILRGGEHTNGFGYDDVLGLARGARGDDPFGYRAGFLTVVDLAKGLERR